MLVLAEVAEEVVEVVELAELSREGGRRDAGADERSHCRPAAAHRPQTLQKGNHSQRRVLISDPHLVPPDRAGDMDNTHPASSYVSGHFLRRSLHVLY